MILAADTVGVLTILGAITGFLTGAGGLLVTFRRDKNTNVQAAIELALSGSGGLIKNLQDEIKRANDSSHACEERCDRLEAHLSEAEGTIRTLQRQVEGLELEKSNWEAAEIAYKRRLGEING